jgi:hypothetical protein
VTAELGRLEPVPLREVWPHEANDFTPWLAQSENLALLAKTLNLGQLGDVRIEVQVVNFYIDILAKDELGDAVLIENQFGPTDHRHLGQIMTYLAGQEGHVTVVWIAETFGEAHRAAIDWLNASTIDGFDFFAVEIETWRIGASAPAPRFNVVGKPNSWSRSVSVATRADGELQSQYAAYWAAFNAFLKERAAPFEVAGNPVSWSVRFPLGAPGASLQASAARGNNRVAVELLLTNKTTSKALFDQIRQDQSAIEREIGEPLEWLRQNDYIVSRVAIATKSFDVSDREQWPKQHGWLLDYLLKFKAAFQDRVSAFVVSDAANDSEAAE